MNCPGNQFANSSSFLLFFCTVLWTFLLPIPILVKLSVTTAELLRKKKCNFAKSALPQAHVLATLQCVFLSLYSALLLLGVLNLDPHEVGKLRMGSCREGGHLALGMDAPPSLAVPRPCLLSPVSFAVVLQLRRALRSNSIRNIGLPHGAGCRVGVDTGHRQDPALQRCFSAPCQSGSRYCR